MNGVVLNSNKVFVVLQYVGDSQTDHTHEIQGVFSDEQKAIKACLDDNHCYGQFTLDEVLPLETVEIESGWVYPTRKYKVGNYE